MEQTSGRAAQLFLVIDRIRRAWKRLSFCPELNKSQFWTLYWLYRSQKGQPEGRLVTLSALAHAMGQSMPAVCQRISRLEAMGYVERVPDPRDKRSTGLRISDGGASLLNTAYTRMAQTMEEILEVLGEDETEDMFRMLARLAEAMEAHQEPAAERRDLN